MVSQTYPVVVVRWHWYNTRESKLRGLGMLSFHPSYTAARNFASDFTLKQQPDEYILVKHNQETLQVTPSTFDGLQSQGTAFIKHMSRNPNHH